jgi:hypothetical protein
MSFRVGHWVAGVVFGAAVATGCGEETRFFIVQNQVPSVDNGSCSIPSAKADVYAGEGTLDVALVGGGTVAAYDMYPLLQNDLPRAGQAGAVEPNRLFVKGFRVKLDLDPSAPASARQVFDAMAADATARRNLAFDEPWSGTVDPGGGVIATGVTVVTGEVARRLASAKVFDTVPTVRVFARVQALGSREQGDVETPEFRFPIKVCAGCLVSFLGKCPVAVRTHQGNACNLAQDRAVDCCSANDQLVCPAPVMAATTAPMTPATTTPTP